MLTYDSLIEQAKAMGMPLTKMRGVLREYAQILILKELYKTESGKKLYFTGGTYLRLAHDIKRFSEDLDFSTNKIKTAEFESVLKKIKIELKRSDISSEVRFTHWDNMYVAKIIFPEIEKIYSVVSKYSKKQGIRSFSKIELKKQADSLRPFLFDESDSGLIANAGHVIPALLEKYGAHQG